MCACGYAGKGGIQIDVERKLNRRNVFTRYNKNSTQNIPACYMYLL